MSRTPAIRVVRDNKPVLAGLGVLTLTLVFCAAAWRFSAAAAPAASDTRTLYPLTAAERGWKSIVVHHSATTSGDVASIDSAHRRRTDRSGKPWLGIGYHFVIGNGQSMGDGEVQPTFRWTQQLAGAHAGTTAHNEHGIGICLIGNFDLAPPTPRQMTALVTLLDGLSARYQLDRKAVVCHRDVQATACPGKLFPWDQVMASMGGRPRGWLPSELNSDPL